MTNPATSERERECENCGDRRLWHQPACGLCACGQYALKETLAELRARADAAEAEVARLATAASAQQEFAAYLIRLADAVRAGGCRRD